MDTLSFELSNFRPGTTLEEGFEQWCHYLSGSFGVGRRRAHAVVIEYLSGEIAYDAWRNDESLLLNSFKNDRAAVMGGIRKLIALEGPVFTLEAMRAGRPGPDGIAGE